MGILGNIAMIVILLIFDAGTTTFTIKRIQGAVINRYGFEDLDNIITLMSTIANSQNPTSGEYLMLTKYELEGGLARIRYKIQESAVTTPKKYFVEMGILCDIVQEWISYIYSDSCKGTYVRIARYIFEIYDIFDIVETNMENDTFLTDCCKKAEQSMTLIIHSSRYLHDRDNILEAIKLILEKIDIEVVDKLKEKLGSGEIDAGNLKLLNTLCYIQTVYINITMAIKNCYITNFHLTSILESANSLLHIYELTIKQQFIEPFAYDKISRVNYMQIYLNRTRQIHYVDIILKRFTVELCFHCINMNLKYIFICGKPAYFSVLMRIISNLKSQVSDFKSRDNFIALFDETAKLYEVFLAVAKNESSIEQIQNIDTEINKAILLVYEKFGYTTNNIVYYFMCLRCDWPSLIYIPNSSEVVYHVKTYYLLSSLASIAEFTEIKTSDSMRYFVRTFFELRSLQYHVDNERVDAIINDLKHKLPCVYHLYLCSFISSTSSLHLVDDVFGNYDSSLLDVLNTFFRDSIQKIYRNKLACEKQGNPACTSYMYLVISVEFLKIFYLPADMKNEMQNLSLLIDRLAGFHAQYVIPNEETREITNTLYDAVSKLALSRKTDVIDCINIRFVILSMNFISYKIVMNIVLRSKEEFNKGTKERTITKEYNQVVKKYCSIYSSVLNYKCISGYIADNLNGKFLDFICKNITGEIFNQYGLDDMIFGGYFLIFGQKTAVTRFSELLISYRKLTINTALAKKYEYYVLQLLNCLRVSGVLRYVQNKEFLCYIANHITMRSSFILSENPFEHATMLLMNS